MPPCPGWDLARGLLCARWATPTAQCVRCARSSAPTLHVVDIPLNGAWHSPVRAAENSPVRKLRVASAKTIEARECGRHTAQVSRGPSRARMNTARKSLSRRSELRSVIASRSSPHYGCRCVKHPSTHVCRVAQGRSRRNLRTFCGACRPANMHARCVCVRQDWCPPLLSADTPTAAATGMLGSATTTVHVAASPTLISRDKRHARMA